MIASRETSHHIVLFEVYTKSKSFSVYLQHRATFSGVRNAIGLLNKSSKHSRQPSQSERLGYWRGADMNKPQALEVPLRLWRQGSRQWRRPRLRSSALSLDCATPHNTKEPALHNQPLASPLHQQSQGRLRRPTSSNRPTAIGVAQAHRRTPATLT